MQTVESGSSAALSGRMWRDLAQLGVEALAIGVVFSVLLALAVYVIAKNDHGADVAAPATAVAVAVASR
jgi:hypothetical protein